MRRLSVIFLLVATSLRAQTAPREIFPSDFTPDPCALAVSCISFPDSSMRSAGFQFLAFNIDDRWIAKHGAEMKAALAPMCRQHATCQTYPMNSYMFCDDVLSLESRPLCEKMFPKSASEYDWTQCHQWLETYLMGIDQNGINTWKAAQACAKKEQPATHTKPLVVWMSPDPLPYEFKDYVTIYALDPDTHVPVLAHVEFENQTIFCPANPDGSSASYYGCKFPDLKYIHVTNAEGHTDAIPPMVTVSAPGYPSTSFRLPAAVPKAIVEMTPAALHPGKNEITVTAKDSLNGKNIDGRVMLGHDEIGFAGQPIAIEIKHGEKRPELWFKPYLNRYGDVVVAPAGK